MVHNKEELIHRTQWASEQLPMEVEASHDEHEAPTTHHLLPYYSHSISANPATMQRETTSNRCHACNTPRSISHTHIVENEIDPTHMCVVYIYKAVLPIYPTSNTNGILALKKPSLHLHRPRAAGRGFGSAWLPQRRSEW